MRKRAWFGLWLIRLDAALLRPGDLAVTRDGTHVLAYLGATTWIQADPVPMRVHVDRLDAQPGGWFLSPIVVLRWRALTLGSGG